MTPEVHDTNDETNENDGIRNLNPDPQLQSSGKSSLALDIFGYRLCPTSKTTAIEIHRPDWMTPLPLSIVCPAMVNHYTIMEL
jgi:hypothetical protein